jgi:hypothetical protein
MVLNQRKKDTTRNEKKEIEFKNYFQTNKRIAVLFEEPRIKGSSQVDPMSS